MKIRKLFYLVMWFVAISPFLIAGGCGGDGKGRPTPQPVDGSVYCQQNPDSDLCIQPGEGPTVP